MTDLVRVHQAQLLEAIWGSLGGRFPAKRVQEAFFAVPRHLFVERYCTLAKPESREVSEENLVEHLPAIYDNGGLGIYYEPGDPRVATISAPWIVLEMLELLDLSPGHRVFEVGTGSGWNAGLMGHLVAPGGSIETIEILPELVESARRGLERAGITNVKVVLGDGSLGPAEGIEAFDRAVFTAGASDLPSALFTRVRQGGLLLFVLAIPGGGNVLILFERRGDVFESLATRRCAFVPVTGEGSAATRSSEPLDSLPGWSSLSRQLVEQRPFSVSASGPTPLQDRSVDLRSYLWLADPGFRSFADADGHPSFGIYDGKGGSLALVRGGQLNVFGTPEAGRRLRNHIHAWADLGLPGLADLRVTAFPASLSPSCPPGEGWLLQRTAAAFWFRQPTRAT